VAICRIQQIYKRRLEHRQRQSPSRELALPPPQENDDWEAGLGNGRAGAEEEQENGNLDDTTQHFQV